MQHLLPLFPFIQKSKSDFEYENKLLHKVTLTGKINSDETTVNLFEYTEDTNAKFAELKNNLINLLLDENINTVVNELKSKAESTIDILIRNLFERTADVGFLATDTQIIDFLRGEGISKKELHNRLHEYVLKYSVYNEIVIFDTKGEVKINLNADNSISTTNDEIIAQTLASDSYVERYAYTDIFKAQKKTLTYTQKIVDGNVTIGVLCLCFKFDDELYRIFENLKTPHETILLVENSKIIASNNPQQYPLEDTFQYAEDKYAKEKFTLIKNSFAVSAKTNGYQGYSGLPWSAVLIKENKHSQVDATTPLMQRSFMNAEISKIIEHADYIIADLGDIIINGELIAAKRRMYILNPILDNLRSISLSLLETIKNAGNNLESLVQQSLKFNLESSSNSSMDIMDRNLYERANDSRWWALTPLFIEELSSETPNSKKLNSVLEYINGLYTVYTNLFIYDKNGKIVASSTEPGIIGKNIRSDAVTKTLQNKNTQHYFVSEFEKTEFYNNEPTYIYHASINNATTNVGGITVVFDSTVEFLAILNDSFTTNSKGSSLFIDNKGMVISSTNALFEKTSLFPLDANLLNEVTTQESYYGIVTLHEKSFLLASTRSKGYREYKVSDNYRNSVIALT
ncbi:MAG: hypothetical protein COS13_10900, partial [Sulfurimonas sp. CG01_land_8_20_14_3_00_36_23]